MGRTCGACHAENPADSRFCSQCGAPALAAPLDDTSADRLPEQRRLVTAVFADLSGFTSLSERLDPETLSEIIGDVITRLSQVVDRHGGTVLNYAGDAILAGFGIPTSSGDDAERALAAALDMREALAARLPALPPAAHGLTLHIGVNSGHAIARYTGASAHVAYTVLGDAVNTAQRLEAAAPADEIYVGALAAELGGDRFVLEHLDPIRVKGKADVVEVWRLVGRREHAVRTRPGASMRLVGRDAIVERLTALGSTGGVRALVGEPGIGKTSIVVEASQRSPGHPWAIGATGPYDAGPYAPWHGMLGLRPDSPLASIDAVDTSDDSPDAASSRRHAFHEAVMAMLASMAPVTVVLDDVQWLDPASALLATDVADRIASGGLPAVSLVLTARPEGAGVVHRIIGDEAEHLIERLDGLDPTDLAELLASRLGGPPTPRLVATIESRTGGSPFFVVELVKLLVDEESIVETPTGWDLAEGDLGANVPPTVEELVQGRLDRLDAGSRSVVELASVIGTRVPVDVLDRASGGGVTDQVLGRLVDGGILVRRELGDVVEFCHGIVREVAYHRTLRGTRRQLHGHVATALRAAPASQRVPLAELAQHLFHADAGAEAVEALEAAAREATAMYANESAAALLTQAVESAERHALGDAVRRLRVRRAALSLTLGRGDEALTEFRALSRSSDPAVRREATLGVARTLRYRGEFDAALSVIDGLPDRDDARCHVLRASVLGGAGRPAEAVDACTDGLALAEPGEVRVELLLERAQSYDRLGLVDEAFRDATEAESLTATGMNPHQRLRALRVLGGLLVDHDRLDEAEATLGEAAELAERGGVALELAGCLVSLSFVHQRRGDLTAAIDTDRRAVQVLRRIRHSFEGGALANLAHKLCDAGDLDDAARIATESLDASRRTGDPFTEADARYALGRVAAMAGRADEADRELRTALALLADIGTTLMVDDIEAALRNISADQLTRAGLGDGSREELDGRLPEP